MLLAACAARVSLTAEGRQGRFGWKAPIPNPRGFVRDAVHVELGMTMDDEPSLTFGVAVDDVPDPGAPLSMIDLLTDYLAALAPPPRQPSDDAVAVARGETVFSEVACASCHTPALEGADGPVPLYSDLLMHAVLPVDALGIEDGAAGMRDFRTAPLWGIATTAPYLHDGPADTLEEAIEGHAGEADGSVVAYQALSDAERDAPLAFLRTL